MVGVFFLFAAIALGIRLFAGGLDKQRIHDFARSHGWELVKCEWTPFGPGWMGSQQARIYRISYRDRDGKLHHAHAKTSLFGDVYLTTDSGQEELAKSRRTRVEELEAENRRLRRALENQN